MAESSTGQCWEQTHQRVIIIQDKDSVTAGSTGASHSVGEETGSLPRVVGVEGTARDLQERGLWATWAGRSQQEVHSCLCVQLVGSRSEQRGTRPKAKPGPAQKGLFFQANTLGLNSKGKRTHGGILRVRATLFSFENGGEIYVT